MKDLIEQCQKELKRTRKMKKSAPEHEQKIYSGMITDLEIAIAWMETGRPPGRVKGVYGHYIHNAIALEQRAFDYVRMRQVNGTAFPDPILDIEDKIDREIAVKKREAISMKKMTI